MYFQLAQVLSRKISLFLILNPLQMLSKLSKLSEEYNVLNGSGSQFFASLTRLNADCYSDDKPGSMYVPFICIFENIT